MSRGRPAGIRSALLTGSGGPLSADQWDAVEAVLLEFYDEPTLRRSGFSAKPEGLEVHRPPGMTAERAAQASKPDEDAPDWGPSPALDDLFARYQAQVQAESNVVGVEAERADLRAIAKDCRQLAGLLPVEPITDWPEKLCARLSKRLVAFPPIADAALRAAGVDVWLLLERLRATVPSPHKWAGTPTLSADLIALAEACELPVEQDTRTQPSRTARDRFVRGLADLIEATPLTFNDIRTERAALIREVCVALGVPAPDRPYALPRQRD